MRADVDTRRFDVFLCHNLRDKYFVVPFVERLTHDGYNVWLDDVQLAAGGSLTAQVDSAIQNCRAAIVVIGANGAGEFQRHEEIARLVAASDMPVVPVLAAGAAQSDAELLGRLFPEKLYANFAQSHPDPFPAAEWTKLRNGLGPPQKKPSLPSATATGAAEVDAQASALASGVANGSLSVFLGTTWRDGLENDHHPDTEELAAFLLKEAARDSEPPAEYVPSLEEAARIFELMRGTRELDDVAVGRFVNPRTTLPSERFDRIASMLAEMGELRVQRENGTRRSLTKPIVIYTTSIENRLERSLIRKGTPFVRLVVHRGGEAVTASAYVELIETASGIELKSPSGASRLLNFSDVRRTRMQELEDQRKLMIDALHAQGVPEDRFPDLEHVAEVLPLSKLLADPAFEIDPRSLDNEALRQSLPKVCIVKLVGASGIPNSFAMTTGRVLALGDLEEKLPDIFGTVLQNDPRVFFGFSPAEQMFQNIHHAFLRNRIKPGVKTFFVADGYAQSDDKRGFFERMIGSDRIAAALSENLSTTLAFTTPAEFATAFMKHYRSEFESRPGVERWV